jgi:hypothetical protein
MTPFQTALNNGVFTIEQVAAAFRNDGYIMEGRGTIGSICNRTLIGSIESDFESYCSENRIPIDDSIHLTATATDQGEVKGNFRYIVYDSNRYTLRQATRLLVEANTAERTIRDLEEQTL